MSAFDSRFQGITGAVNGDDHQNIHTLVNQIFNLGSLLISIAVGVLYIYFSTKIGGGGDEYIPVPDPAFQNEGVKGHTDLQGSLFIAFFGLGFFLDGGASYGGHRQ